MYRVICLFFISAVFSAVFAQSSSGLSKGNPLPPLEYITLDNAINKIDWNNDDDQVYLIDFWATWCAPCVASIPHMDSLMNMYKGEKVKFISITYEPEKVVKEFLKKHPMSSEIGIDTSFNIFRSFNGWAIPNIVMVNARGKFAGRIHPNKLNGYVINVLLLGGIPNVENTKEDMFDPSKSEQYFRSFLDKQMQ